MASSGNVQVEPAVYIAAEEADRRNRETLRKRLRGASCETCFFWEHNGNNHGDCRALPPVRIAMTHGGRSDGWPNVHGDRWCGSWLAAAEHGVSSEGEG